MKKLFKKEQSVEILKILGLINSIEEYQEIYNHVWRKHKSRISIKKIKWSKKLFHWRNCFIEEIKQNELISKKHKKVCATLNYIEQFLILASTITWCISISAFASLIGTPIEITNSAIWLKICAITAGIKNYKSIIKKNKRGMIK